MSEGSDPAKRLAALQALAGRVAHDLNNLLAVIGGNAELLLEIVPEASELRGFLEPIRTASDRSGELVDSLLTHLRDNG